MNFDTHIYPFLLALLSAGLGIFGTLYWPIYRDNKAYRKNTHLLGEWLSEWTDTENPGAWVSEKVCITVESGKLVMRNRDSSGGYLWEGNGELHDNGRYFYGTWRSLKPGSNSTGVFSFLVLSQGDGIVGHAFGPDKTSRQIKSNWAMGRSDQTLNSAKTWLQEFGLPTRKTPARSRGETRTPNKETPNKDTH